MARLLVLLACARGAAGIMDALDIKAVCEVATDGGPRKIYLDMDAEAFETLRERLRAADFKVAVFASKEALETANAARAEGEQIDITAL